MPQQWTISEPSALLGAPTRTAPQKPLPDQPEALTRMGNGQAGLSSPQPSGALETATQLARLLSAQSGLRFSNRLRVETAGGGLAESDFQKSMEWLRLHQCEYAGQWVALAGGELIAADNSAQAVLRRANQRGVQLPLVVKVADPETPHSVVGR